MLFVRWFPQILVKMIINERGYNMEVHGFSGKFIDEKMYILCEDSQILMIDAVLNKDADDFIDLLKPHQITIILTHEHIDHIYGVNYYKKKYNCKVVCSNKCGKLITNPKTNLALYSELICREMEINRDYFCTADETFVECLNFKWKEHEISIMETPGHSEGSVCINIDNAIIFTGDTLLRDKRIITNLPGGSIKKYKEKVLPFIKNIHMEMMVYPGHGPSGYMYEFMKNLDKSGQKNEK